MWDRICHKLVGHGDILFDKMNIDYVPSRILRFFVSPNMGTRVSGDSTKTEDELEMQATRNIVLVGFGAFSVTK